MIPIKFTHPLQWPQHTPVTPKWERGMNPSFKPGLSIIDALTFLQQELEALKVQQVTLNTDYENIGNPRQIRRVGQENGAVLNLRINDKIYHFACDRWVAVEQNIYALHLALQYLRHVAGWGVGTLEQVFSGFSPRVQPVS